MTACTNHGGKARRVVTAALVGVLSVGTVPMVALAEGVNDGIQTLALSAEDAFEQGTMTEARDSQNRKLEIPADGIVTVSAGNWVVPTEITPKDGDPVEVIDYVMANTDKDVQNAEIRYTDPNGSTKGHSAAAADANFFKASGVYTVEVKMLKGDYAGYTFTTTFVVEGAADLSDATLFDKTGGVSDTTFTYNGSAQQIGVAVGGKEVTTGYTMVIDKRLNANGTADSQNNVSAINAGTYVANIYEGSTASAANLKKKITFTVNQVNLSTAKVSVADVLTSNTGLTTSAVDIVYVDGVKFTVSGNQVDTLAEVTPGQKGKASVIVTPDSTAAGNIVGKATVEFNVVDSVLALGNVKYNDSVITDIDANGNPVVNINAGDGESFKPERIEVFGTVAGSTYSDKLNASYYTVSYTDANGKAVDASALANPGVYTVTIDVNSEACRYAYGDDNISFKVNVTSATVEASDVVFKFDGKVGNNFKATYDGTDVLERLETVVHTKWGDDLVEGTDYTVQAYKGDDKVDSVVDAGNYTVKVELKGNHSGLTAADLKCDIEVQPLNLSAGLYVNGGDLTTYTWNDGNNWWPLYKTMWYVSYTGEDLEPSFELGYYTDTNGVAVYNPANASDYTWHALPADAVEVTGYRLDGKPVDALNAKGEYEVEFALNSDNYTVSGKTTSNVITVSDAKVGFVDVAADAWYAQGVFDAKQLGYVKGVSGTDMYAPESKISRADALIIISRMAGFDQTVTAEDYLSVNGGYVTRYTDVDMGAYYAKAIAWGTKMGIVNGYGDGTFGPDDPITREQFAGMLANYAKATGDYTAPSADALAGIADADTVDAWATEAVSWAVENGVMGNGGYVYGQNDISRAEVACMAVNYQPEGASTSVIG